MAEHNNVNGNYGTQQSYNPAEAYGMISAAPSASDVKQTAAATAPASGNPAGSSEEKPPTKEEIGWFFVEQYYKTLCNEPGKLYLYYNKRSQFVSGDEAERVQVAVGQKAISERIKQLDIKDCKVRVLNVDSQESLKSIVVQVIGEMSNKAEPHRKFVQTFVLAEQPSGYYVLNDVFRYIQLDEDEFENGAAGTEAVDLNTSGQVGEDSFASVQANSVSQPAAIEEVDKKLDEEIQETSATKNINGEANTSQEPIGEDPATTGETQSSSHLAAEAAETSASQADVEAEKPHDPEPSPVIAPAKAAGNSVQAEPAAAEPPRPAAPKTWANLVAANRTAAPAPASTTSATSNSNTNTLKPKAAPASKEPATTSNSAGDESPAKSQQNGNAGWQTAGSSNDKRQNRQHSQSASGNQGPVLGYVKNVTDKVDASILKERLEQSGKLVYFDVSRQKNCAFVQFADAAAFNAIAAANPLMIGEEQVIVEERRPRANGFGNNFANRGGMRGGRPGTENRPNNPGRGGRGGFSNRAGRGGGLPARGRTDQPQAA